jgi:hypothetical protein
MEEDGSWAFATAQAKAALKMARKMILFIGKTSIVKSCGITKHPGKPVLCYVLRTRR